MIPSKRRVLACTKGEFLGYGNPNAPVWLIGIEEHGAEVRSGAVSLHASLDARTSFGISEGLATVWNEVFQHPASKLKYGTWWWASRFMLALEGRIDPSKDEIKAYRETMLGSPGGASFLPDLYPLPMNKRDYRTWYANAPWPSYQKYTTAVGPDRAKRILDLASRGCSPRVLIAYSRVVGDALRAAWRGDVLSVPGIGREDGAIWESLRNERREIRLAVTPFWGQGRYSKVQLLALAESVRDYTGPVAS